MSYDKEILEFEKEQLSDALLDFVQELDLHDLYTIQDILHKAHVIKQYMKKENKQRIKLSERWFATYDTKTDQLQVGNRHTEMLEVLENE